MNIKYLNYRNDQKLKKDKLKPNYTNKIRFELDPLKKRILIRFQEKAHLHSTAIP